MAFFSNRYYAPQSVLPLSAELSVCGSLLKRFFTYDFPPQIRAPSFMRLYPGLRAIASYKVNIIYQQYVSQGRL